MPFTVEEFFRVFAAYNLAIWPLQAVAFAAGLVVITLLAFRRGTGKIGIMLLLAAMWTVNGVGYQLTYFSHVNPAARGFAFLFVAEAMALVAAPFLSQNLFATKGRPAENLAGWLMMLFALFGYPVVGFLAGHSYPAVPLFGVAPCPTVIFTLGVLLVAGARATRWLLVIPIIWSAIGGSAAFLLGVPQDYGLIVSGAVAVLILITDFRRPPVRPYRNRPERYSPAYLADIE